MIPGLTIVGMSILAACLYGMCHDLVTAHLCVEYFTIGHPPLLPTESPILLAVGWGIIATWWVGLLLGIPLALCSRLGQSPPRTARDLLRPIACLLGAMAACSVIAGFFGHMLAVHRVVYLLPGLAQRVPADRHVWFLTDLWAHLSAYITGFIGGIILCVMTVIGRQRAMRTTPPESGQGRS